MWARWPARCQILNPQPNPQNAMSYTTSAYFGSPRGLVSCCKTYPGKTVTAEVASSSLVVPAILSKGLSLLFGKSARYTRKYTLSDACRRRRCFFRWQNHFHHFALRPPLFTVDRVGIDVHVDVAVGVSHQRLHSLHILIIFGKKRRKCVTEHVPTDVLGDLCPFRCRSDVVPLDSFWPKWLTTLHSSAGEDPVLVSGVRRFGTPSQKISNHFVVQRHDLFALFCFHRPQVLLPNRLSDVQRLLSEVDVTPLCGKHFTSTHSGGNV